MKLHFIENILLFIYNNFTMKTTNYIIGDFTILSSDQIDSKQYYKSHVEGINQFYNTYSLRVKPKINNLNLILCGTSRKTIYNNFVKHYNECDISKMYFGYDFLLLNNILYSMDFEWKNQQFNYDNDPKFDNIYIIKSKIIPFETNNDIRYQKLLNYIYNSNKNSKGFMRYKKILKAYKSIDYDNKIKENEDLKAQIESLKTKNIKINKLNHNLKESFIDIQAKMEQLQEKYDMEMEHNIMITEDRDSIIKKYQLLESEIQKLNNIAQENSNKKRFALQKNDKITKLKLID